MMYLYLAIAMTIAALTQAQDSHADGLPYPTEVVYEEMHVLEISPMYKEWLRSPTMEDELPEAILVGIKCLSDTEVEMWIPLHHQDILDILTRRGWIVLHGDMVREAGNVCRAQLEAKYGYPSVTF